LANATFVILVRNHELPAIIKSIKQMEYSFNHQYHYPYVFLNDESFTDEFKEWTSNVVSSKVEYGVIPHDHWYQPDHIDEDKAKANRDEMERNGVIYGGSVSYRNMCRFNSGFFFRHKLLQKYRYYWRVEPGVEFFCDVDEDPFVFLQENNKVYGFTISLYEFESTVQTLWETTKEFIKENPQYVANDNALEFVSDPYGESYNLCHFWSNFEIADMDFWRSEAYMKYFEYLDSKGGFYYERWGDAPVHSIGGNNQFDDDTYTSIIYLDDFWVRGAGRLISTHLPLVFRDKEEFMLLYAITISLPSLLFLTLPWEVELISHITFDIPNLPRWEFRSESFDLRGITSINTVN
ncbi:alpha 1,2-mannosyltransferase 2.4.1, partial [Serendipita sp. 405]